jgi:hypothetical protein
MIELKGNELIFSFPEVHKDAVISIHFQRTLRIPDDDREYPLPPGLGKFPLRTVDDFAENLPDTWLEHGGVMLPMYQSEALWICFGFQGYPFAIKVAAGKINAVTGDTWVDNLNRNPQDYVVSPEQPWLDGFCVEEGIIRQFVAMPLGAGYSAEEQITGAAQHGGLQLSAFPMRAEAYRRYRKKLESTPMDLAIAALADESVGMGLAPGGKMRQQIFDDPFEFSDWHEDRFGRCFVHIANSMVWRGITGQSPPTVPRTAKEYNGAGLPWFDYYAEDKKALKGSKILAFLDSVAQKGKKIGQVPLPENESVDPETVINLRAGLKKGQVREW